MSTTRPRHSVLNLFDPLASFNTSDRDAPDTDSDKENSTPPVTDCSMTAVFFGRAYKPSQSAPLVPKRRLVDIGDITIDDTSMHMMLTDEEELQELNDDENDTLTFFCPTATPARPADTATEPDTPSTSAPRTPLGELTLDRDLTPVARTKMYRRTALPSSSLVAPEILISPPGVDSSITSVINAVNSSGTSFAQFEPSDTDEYLDLIAEDENCGTDSIVSGFIQTPHITISSDPLAEPLSMMNLETPTDSLLTDTTRPPDIILPSPSCNTASLQPPHRLRPNPLKTSSHDPNRRSIDLYSSFQLQLQSEDASFDLLNDKISFLASGSGVDSFMSAMEGDDSFDMGVEEANMEAALEKMRMEDEANKKDDKVSSPKMAGPLIDGCKTSPKLVATQPMSTALETKSGEKRNSQKRLSFGYSPGLNSPLSPTASPPSAKPRTLIQSPRVSVFTAPPSVDPPSTVSTPLAPARDPAVLPPAVPALRIVKRATRFGHGKSALPGSASSMEIPSAPEAPSVSDVPPQRPTPATFSTSSQSTRLASAASGSNCNTGPRRVPIGNSKITVSSGRAVVRSSKDIPINIAGPRRISIATPMIIPPMSITQPLAGKLPVVTGLRAPTKYSTGIGGTSALPRPASRLPAPTTVGTGKLKIANSAGGTGSGIAGLGKSIPTRRMMYGGQ